MMAIRDLLFNFVILSIFVSFAFVWFGGFKLSVPSDFQKIYNISKDIYSKTSITTVYYTNTTTTFDTFALLWNTAVVMFNSFISIFPLMNSVITVMARYLGVPAEVIGALFAGISIYLIWYFLSRLLGKEI